MNGKDNASRFWAFFLIAPVVAGVAGCLMNVRYGTLRLQDWVYMPVLFDILVWLLPLGLVFVLLCGLLASGWDIDRLVTGRMTRRGYWLRAILIGIVVCVPVTACTVLCCGPSLDAAQLMKMTSVTTSLNPVLVQCLLFPTVVRRLHDMGRSSLLARIQFALVLPTLLGGISPLVALIASVLAFVPLTILGLYVSFWPGTPDRNAYGPNPRDPDAGGRNAEAAPGSQAEAKWLPLVRRLFQGLCFCAALLLFAASVVLQIRISRAYARDLAAHEMGYLFRLDGARSEYVVPDSYIYRGPSTSGRSPKDPDAKVDWSAFDAPGGKTSGR